MTPATQQELLTGPYLPGSLAGTLLLGLGNDLLSDDAIGLRICRELVGDSGLRRAGVKVVETSEMGLALLDIVEGCRRLIVVDSILTGSAPAGTMHTFEAAQIRTLPTISPHFLGVGEMLALGSELGLPMPSSVRILAIEVADPFTIGTSFTQEILNALPNLVTEVRNAVLA